MGFARVTVLLGEADSPKCVQKGGKQLERGLEASCEEQSREEVIFSPEKATPSWDGELPSNLEKAKAVTRKKDWISSQAFQGWR